MFPFDDVIMKTPHSSNIKASQIWWPLAVHDIIFIPNLSLSLHTVIKSCHCTNCVKINWGQNKMAVRVMMTPSNGNIFCVTGHLCREFTGRWWIPCTKASNAELWCFQGCQVLLNFSILLLKWHFRYWNFHEILTKILKFVLIYLLLPHKNTEICVKLCKNTEIIAICYWSEFPEVGSPVFSLICASINGWVNNGEAGDLRCHHVQYDVIIMGYTAFSSADSGTLLCMTLLKFDHVW